MSVATGVLVVLSNISVLFVAEFAIKRTKRSGNLALDRFLLCNFILRVIVYKEPIRPEVAEAIYLSSFLLRFCFSTLAFGIKITTLGHCQGYHSDVLRRFP